MAKTKPEPTQPMRVSTEQLAVFPFAKGSKARTIDQTDGAKSTRELELSQVLVEAGGRAVASDGTALAIVRYPVHEDEASGRERVLVSGSIVRGISEAVNRHGTEGVEVTRSSSGAFVFRFRDQDTEEEIQEIIAAPVSEEYPDYAPLVAAALGAKPKARIAIESKTLARVAALRAKVGGHGPVMFDFAGEIDSIVARWELPDGQRALVIVQPTKLDPEHWAKASEAGWI